MSEPPVVASYCTTFLKREMAHIYRQVTGLSTFKTFVMAKTRLNADRYPFDDVELVGKPTKNFLRRFYLKYIRRAEAVVYRGEFQVLDGILRRRRAQLMHIYFGHTAVHLLPFIKAWDKPCLVSFHGADITVREHQPGYEAMLREMLQTVPLVLARSQSLRDQLLQLGCPPERLALNRTGVPLEQFPFVKRVPPSEGKWQLVQACRLIPKKGLVTSLQAFALFREHYPNATFVIAGDGPMRDELKIWVAKLGLARERAFPGVPEPGQALPALRRLAHFFPSQRVDGRLQPGRHPQLDARSHVQRGCRWWRRCTGASPRRWKTAAPGCSCPRRTRAPSARRCGSSRNRANCLGADGPRGVRAHHRRLLSSTRRSATWRLQYQKVLEGDARTRGLTPQRNHGSQAL